MGLLGNLYFHRSNNLSSPLPASPPAAHPAESPPGLSPRMQRVPLSSTASRLPVPIPATGTSRGERDRDTRKRAWLGAPLLLHGLALLGDEGTEDAGLLSVRAAVPASK